MNQMVTTIKEVHDVDECMFKMENFYHVFGNVNKKGIVCFEEIKKQQT